MMVRMSNESHHTAALAPRSEPERSVSGETANINPIQVGPHGLVTKVRTTLGMIKFEHSVFALPFALTGALLARRGWPTWHEFAWLVLAMVGARSAAMSFNRLVDLESDALNPRTRTRALPAGHLSSSFATGFTAASCALLLVAAFELSPLAFKL